MLDLFLLGKRGRSGHCPPCLRMLRAGAHACVWGLLNPSLTSRSFSVAIFLLKLKSRNWWRGAVRMKMRLRRLMKEKEWLLFTGAALSSERASFSGCSVVSAQGLRTQSESLAQRFLGRQGCLSSGPVGQWAGHRGGGCISQTQ